MTPTQLSRQCLDFWEAEIKLAYLCYITPAEPFTICQSQIMRKTIQQIITIYSPFFTVLLKLNYMLSYFLIGSNQRSVHSPKSSATTFFQCLPDVGNQIWVTLSLYLFHFNLYYCFCNKSTTTMVIDKTYPFISSSSVSTIPSFALFQSYIVCKS